MNNLLTRPGTFDCCTDMELDVMSRIIDALPHRDDVWKLYRDREFRDKAIKNYWSNVHGIGDPTNGF